MSEQVIVTYRGAVCEVRLNRPEKRNALTLDMYRTLAETIETGRFPARPGPSDGRPVRGSNCTYCPYDGMCPPDRVTSWRRKRADRALSSYVALVGET